MSSLFVIPNLIYSGNPFLIKRLHEIVDENNKNLIRKTIMNVKYWYSSMPEECKVLLHKIVENVTFSIVTGTYYRVSPSEAYKHAKTSPDDLEYVLHNLPNSDIHGNNSKNASSYSAVLCDAKNKVPLIPREDAFSLVDKTNDMVFRVSTHKVSLIDKYGNDILELNTKPQHSLIIYGAIRGIQKVKENMDSWEKLRYRESLKDKILEVYNAKEKEA